MKKISKNFTIDIIGSRPKKGWDDAEPFWLAGKSNALKQPQKASHNLLLQGLEFEYFVLFLPLYSINQFHH